MFIDANGCAADRIYFYRVGYVAEGPGILALEHSCSIGCALAHDHCYGPRAVRDGFSGNNECCLLYSLETQPNHLEHDYCCSKWPRHRLGCGGQVDVSQRRWTLTGEEPE